MKIKTLLISAASLAVGVMSSQAQVYSQNVVGYVNVVIPGNGEFSLIANPFDDGNGNYLTNVLGTNVIQFPKNSQALFWNGAGYSTINYGGTPANWAAGTANQITPGLGFFIRNGKPGNGDPSLTNTFVGTVYVPSGGSITNDIPPGLSLQGSAIPYAGNIAYLGTNYGDTNLNYGGVMTVKKSQILTWNSGTGNFSTINFGGSLPYTWSATVPISVGQGFFINNLGSDTNVIQNATY